MIAIVIILAVLGLLTVVLIPLGAWFGRPDIVKGSALVLCAIVLAVFAIAAMSPASA